MFLYTKWCKSKLVIDKINTYNIDQNTPKDNFFLYLLPVKVLYNYYSTKITNIDLEENVVTVKYLQKIFPINYNFECFKLIFRLNNFKIKKVLLQFPEGLQKYGMLINNFLKNISIQSKKFLISSRTVFGACCAEDFLGKFIGACIVLHYGHSCLFPILECTVPMMYVFLEIKFNYNFITDTIKEDIKFLKFNFVLFSTIQFVSILKNIKINLETLKRHVNIYSNKPLSPGEVLGCTCLRIDNVSNIIFIGEGRFHLEATIISNSLCRFLQFNPFSQNFSVSDFKALVVYTKRKKEILKSIFGKVNIGLIIGTLGRQGNNSIIKKMQELICKKNYEYILLSTTEISSDILEIIGFKYRLG